ncbi:MAG: hypothetical protein JNM36_12870 [Chitinophagales bacterium]|nr:hypothetical protein [Chitinophagales bacterium]
MEKVNFKKEKYNADLVIGTFGLRHKVADCPHLDRWLHTHIALNTDEAQYIAPYRRLLETEGDYWNEEELKMHFLAHVFALSQLRESDKIKLFYERSLQSEVDGQSIFVICDCMVATPFGINTPQKPFFFLQEFKRAKKPDDPEGQMLLAMIAAQHQNGNDKPVYGCWLQGRNWVFTTLHQKNYCVSPTYDATVVEELHQIISILRNLKKIILADLA